MYVYTYLYVLRIFSTKRTALFLIKNGTCFADAYTYIILHKYLYTHESIQLHPYLCPYLYLYVYMCLGSNDMAITFAVANQKGGVGKTTTAEALSSGLLQLGYRVLSVDGDQQGNFSYDMQADPDKAGLADVLDFEMSAQDVIQHTRRGNIISAGALGAYDAKTAGSGGPYRMQNALSSLQNDFDFIIIDTPPSLGQITINAFTASNAIIVPALADVYSLQGIGQLYQTIRAVQDVCNKKLIILGVLIARYSDRAILNREVREQLEETARAIDSKLYRSAIRESVVVREAQAARISLFDYAPNSNPALDYWDFINEVLEDCRQQQLFA
jgi:ATPases involved in chromosome partitioning